jgi:hypothetical protein
MTSRERFEAFLRSIDRWPCKNAMGDYMPNTEMAWQAWQEAERQANHRIIEQDTENQP